MARYTRRDLFKTGLTVSAGSALAGSVLGQSAMADASALTGGAEGPFRPAWESLRRTLTPRWLQEGKFGIYTHWGIYAVPAQGPNATWYSHNFYFNAKGKERKHQEATYGPLSKFGYKDFIPMFKAEKFDPEDWAQLFKKSGARFAGPVAEHHDGFSMWDTKYSKWNSVNMGPHRDVVGELAKAIKGQGMKFVTAFHHAANWIFFPVWDKQYDCSDPRYAGLYGAAHERGAPPTKAFLDQWKGKIVEVIDKYDPDMLWFDFGLRFISESYKKDLFAYYYNKAVAADKPVVVTYKGHQLPPGVGINDLERGQESDMTYYEWITDSSIDVQGGWGYVEGQTYKSVTRLVTNLVDRVAKNGYLLLNVGPKADGTIPDEARKGLEGMGEWLAINGESIYGTSPWFTAAEGPTKLDRSGAFNERDDIKFTPEDVRFTVKDNFLYATLLAWPGETATIKTLGRKGLSLGFYPSEIASLTMLGDGKELKWESKREGLVIQMPKTKPCEHAFVIKIVRKKSPF